MVRLYVVLAFFGAVGLFGYVAFAPTVPVWVRHLFHLVIGLLLVGLVAGAWWGINQFIALST